jgi:hypothetical protein
MRRRELLKATGLAAVADLETVIERAESGRTVASAEQETLLARLPAPAETPSDYDVTVARRLDKDVLYAPELLAGADIHAVLLSPRATVTIGAGADPAASGDSVNALERRGFDRAGTVEGRPFFVRRDRYRQRVALVDGGTVVLGRSSALEPVRSLVRAIAVPREGPLGERLPAAAEVHERLGRGAVLTLSPSGARSNGDGPHPLATGSRLALRAPVGRVRTVSVYESPVAGRVALDRASGAHPDTATVRRDGSVVVTDRPVPETDLPLAGE